MQYLPFYVKLISLNIMYFKFIIYVVETIKISLCFETKCNSIINITYVLFIHPLVDRWIESVFWLKWILSWAQKSLVNADAISLWYFLAYQIYFGFGNFLFNRSKVTVYCGVSWIASGIQHFLNIGFTICISFSLYINIP